MTLEEEILKELKWHTKLMEADFAQNAEIKFELIHARQQAELTYTIPLPKKKGILQWIRDKIGC